MTLSFAQPALLALLVLPLALLVWGIRRTSGVTLPQDHTDAPAGSGWRVLVDSAQALAPLLLALAIVLLAGPLRYSVPKTRRVMTNIEFCVDVSGSMTAPFGEGSRYDGSMESINAFLDYRRGDAFGLTIFGNEVLHWIPLTSDVSAFRCAPPFLRPERLPPWFGGTMIGAALRACLKVLQAREEGDRMIILISDGHSGDLYGGRDEEVARKLREAGIVLYAVHVADGDPPGPLITMTSLTGGEVFAAGDPAGLEAVFRRIDAMQPVRMEKTASEAIDHFGPTAMAGLAVLGCLLLAQLGLRYTPW